MPLEIPPTGQPAAMPAPPITTAAPLPPLPPTTAGTQPATPPPQPGEPGYRELGDGRVQILHPSAFKRIKDKERRKGHDDALKELDGAAQAAGFKDAVSAFEAIRGMGGNRGGAPAPQPQPPRREARPGQSPEAPVPPAQPGKHGSRKDWERYERQRQQFERDRASYRDRVAKATQRNRDLQRQIDAQQAEMSLRESAVACGVKDVDYAMRLLTRHLEGKSEAEVDTFDEKKFFGDLRTSKPYLFGETVTPATTGNGGAAPGGSAPQPGATTTAATTTAQVDARKMSREEFQNRLKKMGLNPPTV